MGPAIVIAGMPSFLAAVSACWAAAGATAIVTIASTFCVTKDWMPEAIFAGSPCASTTLTFQPSTFAARMNWFWFRCADGDAPRICRNPTVIFGGVLVALPAAPPAPIATTATVSAATASVDANRVPRMSHHLPGGESTSNNRPFDFRGRK